MGITRYTSGEIIFDPPLQAVELRRPELAPYLGGPRAVHLIVHQRPVETDEGSLIRRTCDVIQPTLAADDLCSGYINKHLPEHLAELVGLINGIVHPEHGARSYGHSCIEVYRDAGAVADFEAYQLRVRPTRDGRTFDPPAVHRTDARITWQDEHALLRTPALRPERLTHGRG